VIAGVFTARACTTVRVLAFFVWRATFVTLSSDLPQATRRYPRGIGVRRASSASALCCRIPVAIHLPLRTPVRSSQGLFMVCVQVRTAIVMSAASVQLILVAAALSPPCIDELALKLRVHGSRAGVLVGAVCPAVT